jgi:hypothetical protein
MALSAELAQALERRDESRRELQAMLIIVAGVVTLLQSELKEKPAPPLVETPRRTRWWAFWERG